MSIVAGKIGNGAAAPVIMPAVVGELQYQQSVPRHVVHRAAVNEVFLTDSCAAGINRYAVAAQLPRGHELYADRPVRRHDPMLLAEVCRQSSLLVGHKYLGVPAGWVFVSRKLQMAIFDHELFAVGDKPTDIVVDVEVDRNFKNKGFLTNAGMTYTVVVDGKAAAKCGSSLIYLPPESYGKLRAEGMAKKSLPGPDFGGGSERVAPEEVGRSNSKNVVIGRGRDRMYPICIATEHPSLFDHEVDHISGAVLLEASRQAALQDISAMSPELWPGSAKFSRLEVASLEVTFADFAELSAPAFCRVVRSSFGRGSRVGEPVEMELAIVQCDAQVADVRLSLLMV
ncbi:ScbA/BarX family gamma-butyrolactone biosynthesis protein [Nocardia sp. 2YAB30]|uniref:ScbA/BarX family gamma-butyrolactone biosynthesis protein n=1 Tax=unclassified Nocardia TaxID=2637762 RepID=UPI003F99F2B5